MEKQPERAGAGSGELADARILLVGFPANERQALEHALANWGATAVAVANVEEGVSRLIAEISLAKPYYSALLYAADDDPQLAQRFRRAAPDPAPPTVLAVPREAAARRFEALAAGFTAVLELPFDKRQLFNVLHSVSAGEEAHEGVVRLQDYAKRGSAPRKLHILVADDNPTNREVLGKILERGGHAPVLVNDGEQVLDALEQQHYDIAILDRNLPRLGGLEALQALRLMARPGERLPVIVLSADVTPDAKREALEAGADAFLGKPIEALRLLEEVHALTARGEEPRRAEPPGIVGLHSPGLAETLNVETLGHLEQLGSSPSFIEKLAEVFVADTETLLERMEQALGARNQQEFRSLLHAMKGSCASMGADRLTKLCTSLGKLSDAQLRLQAAGLARTLSDELAAVHASLERYVRERAQSTG